MCLSGGRRRDAADLRRREASSSSRAGRTCWRLTARRTALRRAGGGDHPADDDTDRSRSAATQPRTRTADAVAGRLATTGTHPLVPGTTFHGRTSFAWHEGGAFVVMRSEIDEPEVPSGVAVIGSDDAAGTLTMIYFDERDVSRRYTVEVGDREVVAPRRGGVRPAHGPSPSPATAAGSTRGGRCRARAAPGRTTCS